MADHLPRNSSSVQDLEVIAGRNILDKLRDGNLNTETASRKDEKFLSNTTMKISKNATTKCEYYQIVYPTVTDLEYSLDETQDELEDEIIRLEDTKKNLHQFIEIENEDMMRIIQLKNEDMMRCLQEKDEESARKDEINRRLQGENNRKDRINGRLQEENHRKDEIITKLEEEIIKRFVEENKKKEEEKRYKEIIKRLVEENNRKEEELIQLR
ncbi:unnamed protein product [Mytilus edulis]|uniref:Uncharacterized protein n=1 Tax=Mytilus edulis TaxID=6550 RepID=A0A8S3SD71_MYTED|nr:unnamed protein product [Mytilus edulis]